MPNGFLVEMATRLPMGRILCLGEGESRNAVWLAQRGYEVTAVGLKKAQRLAASRGVKFRTAHADLAAYDIESGPWEGIVSIFCHLPPALRADVHRRSVAGLRSGGVMLLEAYTPRQIRYGTGGPATGELMMDRETLRSELAGLEFLHLQECERDIREGELHNGVGAVLQAVARKP